MCVCVCVCVMQVCAVVGGMAAAKQERVLSRHPPIVVATPGRLWKLMNDVSEKMSNTIIIIRTCTCSLWQIKINTCIIILL